MKIKAFLLALVAVVSLVQGSVSAQAQTSVRIRGEITAVEPTTLTVKHQNGETVKVAIKPDQAVSAVKKMPLVDVKPGSYIGTATKSTPDGELVAMEVLVFPEAARGTSEGHFPWDLAPGSMMTNANVDSVVSAVNGRTMVLSYKGGSKEVTVPENVPVVTPAPATRADLIVGKKVFIVAQGEAPNFTAARIYVEKDGVAPPM